MGECGFGSSVARSCESGNELLGSMKGEDFFDLRNCKLLSKNSTLWS